MEECNLKYLIWNVQFLYECRTCIYGLTQEYRFSYIKLVKFLDENWLIFPHRPHNRTCFQLTLPTTFNLVVNKFGTKVVGKHNADYLINTFKNHYNVTIDWKGGSFCENSV